MIASGSERFLERNEKHVYGIPQNAFVTSIKYFMTFEMRCHHLEYGSSITASLKGINYSDCSRIFELSNVFNETDRLNGTGSRVNGFE